jgi:predicted small lipoprotein YifL
MKLLTALTAFLFFAALAGCDREGPAERAGEAVDRTVERAGDKIEDATDRK